MLTSRFTRPGVPAVLGPRCRVIARSDVTGGLMVNRKISEQGHFMRSLCVPLFVGHKIIERIRANCELCPRGGVCAFVSTVCQGGWEEVSSHAGETPCFCSQAPPGVVVLGRVLQRCRQRPVLPGGAAWVQTRPRGHSVPDLCVSLRAGGWVGGGEAPVFVGWVLCPRRHAVCQDVRGLGFRDFCAASADVLEA